MKALFVIALLASLTACAGNTQQSPMDSLGDDPVAKVIDRGYKLGEEVKRINNYMIDGWQYVSDDAIIIPARPSLDYLVLLRSPCHSLRSTNTIGLTSTTGSVLSNFDAIVVFDAPRSFEEKCFIDTMYTLEKDDSKE